jgi:hypothetical protein
LISKKEVVLFVVLIFIVGFSNILSIYAQENIPKRHSPFIISINTLLEGCNHCSNIYTNNIYIANPNTKNILYFMSAYDTELQSRITKSSLIIVGEVSNIKPIESTRNFIVTEHDANLTDATITVDEILKGNLSNREIQVVFSNSYDIAWYQFPKLRLGDYGIFFLHQKEKIKDLNEESYTLLNQGDFQSIDNLERIKKLVKSSAAG